jgi:hypothetical protein
VSKSAGCVDLLRYKMLQSRQLRGTGGQRSNSWVNSGAAP